MKLKQIILLVCLLGLLAVGCQKVTLKKEIPSSPRESFEMLPK